MLSSYFLLPLFFLASTFATTGTASGTDVAAQYAGQVQRALAESAPKERIVDPFPIYYPYDLTVDPQTEGHYKDTPIPTYARSLDPLSGCARPDPQLHGSRSQMSIIFYNTCRLAHAVKTTQEKGSYKKEEGYAKNLKRHLLLLREAVEGMVSGIAEERALGRKRASSANRADMDKVRESALRISDSVVRTIAKITGEVDDLVKLCKGPRRSKSGKFFLGLFISSKYLRFLEKHAVHEVHTHLVQRVILDGIMKDVPKLYYDILKETLPVATLSHSSSRPPPSYWDVRRGFVDSHCGSIDGHRRRPVNSCHSFNEWHHSDTVHDAIKMLQQLLLVRSALSAIVLVDMVPRRGDEALEMEDANTHLDMSKMSYEVVRTIIRRSAFSLLPDSPMHEGMVTGVPLLISSQEELDTRRKQQTRSMTLYADDDLTIKHVFDRLVQPGKKDSLDWAVSAYVGKFRRRRLLGWGGGRGVLPRGN